MTSSVVSVRPLQSAVRDFQSFPYAPTSRVWRRGGRRRVRSAVPLAEAFLVEAVCEGKPLATLAPEGGTARAPHREWPMQHSLLSALLARQHVYPNRTVHVPTLPHDVRALLAYL